MTLIEVQARNWDACKAELRASDSSWAWLPLRKPPPGFLADAKFRTATGPCPREIMRNAGQGRFVDHLEDGGKIRCPDGPGRPSKPLKLLGWVIMRGFEARRESEGRCRRLGRKPSGRCLARRSRRFPSPIPPVSIVSCGLAVNSSPGDRAGIGPALVPNVTGRRENLVGSLRTVGGLQGIALHTRSLSVRDTPFLGTSIDLVTPLPACWAEVGIDLLEPPIPEVNRTLRTRSFLQAGSIPCLELRRAGVQFRPS